MKISVGRIVHYIPPVAQGLPPHLAAIVVKVFPDGRVNLRVFPDGDFILGSDFVRLRVAEGPGMDEWHWPERSDE